MESIEPLNDWLLHMYLGCEWPLAKGCAVEMARKYFTILQGYSRPSVFDEGPPDVDAINGWDRVHTRHFGVCYNFLISWNPSSISMCCLRDGRTVVVMSQVEETTAKDTSEHPLCACSTYHGLVEGTPWFGKVWLACMLHLAKTRV